VQTDCNRVISATDTRCDPTGGYHITNTNDIGTISNKHGHRLVEFALKYNF